MPTEDKKDRREKESSPHTPYIEKGETEKKTQLHTRACACEGKRGENNGAEPEISPERRAEEEAFERLVDAAQEV